MKNWLAGFVTALILAAMVNLVLLAWMLAM